MYDKDPCAPEAALLPVVCKDPNEIARTLDLSSLPDPPVYAPLRNMREESKETLRLACYAPNTTAKLLFADANPNYKQDEDVWGALVDYRAEQAHHLPVPIGNHRVKDDCIMS